MVAAAALWRRYLRSVPEPERRAIEVVSIDPYAEGVTNKVKVIKRRAYGLPTFAGFRKRVVIPCG